MSISITNVVSERRVTELRVGDDSGPRKPLFLGLGTDEFCRLKFVGVLVWASTIPDSFLRVASSLRIVRSLTVA